MTKTMFSLLAHCEFIYEWMVVWLKCVKGTHLECEKGTQIKWLTKK